MAHRSEKVSTAPNICRTGTAHHLNVSKLARVKVYAGGWAESSQSCAMVWTEGLCRVLGPRCRAYIALSLECRPGAMEPVPRSITARQQKAAFLTIEGGLIKAIRRTLEAQPGGLFRAALCGACKAPASGLAQALHITIQLWPPTIQKATEWSPQSTACRAYSNH